MKKYVEVDREPIVGDMVKIVDAEAVPTTQGKLDYKNNDILEIIETKEHYGAVNYKYGEHGYQYLYRSEFVVVEEVVQFSKSDLKPCMVVKVRSGDLLIVFESKSGLSLNGSNNSYIMLDSYDEDMIRMDGYKKMDIVSVYSFRVGSLHANEISTDNRELLFKREEQSPRDIKIKELQDKMDEIKREMEELK